MAYPVPPPQPTPELQAIWMDGEAIAKQAVHGIAPSSSPFPMTETAGSSIPATESPSSRLAPAWTVDWTAPAASPNLLLTQAGEGISPENLASPPELNRPTEVEDLAPLLQPADPAAPALESNPSTTFTETPVFSSPSITEPLIDFDALPLREQSIIPIAPGQPSQLTDPVEDALPDTATPSEAPGEAEAPSDASSPNSTESETASPTPDLTGIIELEADNQNFDQQRQVVSAEGNVLMRIQNGVISADRLQVNLLSRVVVANGNAAFVRGQQRLRGERIEYNITQDSGRVTQASGEVYTPTSGTDLLPPGPGVPALAPPESDRVTQAQPITNVSNPGQITITTGFGTNFGPRVEEDNDTSSPADAIQIPISISAFRQEGTINRWRFESDDLALVPGGFDANNVRLTNDPFSPPQFELRAEKIEVRSVSPLVDEILATKPRYVFENKVSIPTFKRRLLLDRRPRDDGLVTFGFDSEDRGGLFFERSFEPISTEKIRFNITPQYFLQRAVFGESDGFLDPGNFGLETGLTATLTPQTRLEASATFTSGKLDDLADNTRAKVELAQALPLGHILDLNYGYRTRVYNGSLGFRTVQQNYGAVVRSPNIPLGNSGIVVNYQGGIQQIISETDRIELLDPIRDNDRVSLTRYQVGASASRGFPLWRGKTLPATAEEGLRYSPVAITPYADFSLSITGLYSGYSNGDTQDSITTTLGFAGQVGHFSKKWLDYTSWNLAYSQALRGDESPFTFDRIEDTRVLSFGARQQLYGPLRLGFQSSLNLQTGERFSTDYLLEYSRRAYGVEFRYNPVLELGSVTLRLSDFNWLGGTNPFRELKTGAAQ